MREDGDLVDEVKTEDNRRGTGFLYVHGVSMNPGTKRHVGSYAVWCEDGHPANGTWWVDGNVKPPEKKRSDVTNQRMELMGSLAAMEAIDRLWICASSTSCAPSTKWEIRTSSSYVVCCMTKWLPRWIENGWITKLKRSVHNGDILRRMSELSQKHDVKIVKVDQEEEGILRVRHAARDAVAVGEASKVRASSMTRGIVKTRRSFVIGGD
jgi:ribonuclease HI